MPVGVRLNLNVVNYGVKRRHFPSNVYVCPMAAHQPDLKLNKAEDAVRVLKLCMGMRPGRIPSIERSNFTRFSHYLTPIVPIQLMSISNFVTHSARRDITSNSLCARYCCSRSAGLKATLIEYCWKRPGPRSREIIQPVFEKMCRTCFVSIPSAPRISSSSCPAALATIASMPSSRAGSPYCYLATIACNIYVSGKGGPLSLFFFL